MAEGWPIFVSGSELTGLLNAKMASQQVVMISANKFDLNGFR